MVEAVEDVQEDVAMADLLGDHQVEEDVQEVDVIILFHEVE